ncbi:MAG: hypothetical protein ACTS2F_15335 [Thainema sp.]
MLSSPAQIELFRCSRRHHQEHPYLWLWLASGSVLAHLALIVVLRPWMIQTEIAPVPQSESDIAAIQLIDAASLPADSATASNQAAPAAETGDEKVAIAKSVPSTTTPQTVILPEQPAKPTPTPSAIAKPSPTQIQERPITAPAPPPVLSPFPKAPEPDSELNPNSPLPSQGQPVPAAPTAPISPTPTPSPAASPLPPTTPPATSLPVSTPEAVSPDEDLTSEDTSGLDEPSPSASPLPSLSPSIPTPSTPIQPAPDPAPSQPERLPDVPTTYDTSQGFNTAPELPLNSIPVQPEAAPSEVVASISSTPTPITDTSRDILDTYAAPIQSQNTFLLSDVESSCTLSDPAAWQVMGRSVSAQVVVDISGQAEIISGTQQGTSNADYDQFALCLVEQHWQFAPATMAGQPVPSDNLRIEVTLSRT